MDRILIADLPVRCKIGVPEQERAVEQELRIDLELSLDLRPSGEADDFGRTVDYAAASGLVQRTAAARPRKLIETLAEDIARVALDSMAIEAVRVRIRKPSALVSFGAAYAGVEIERRRNG
ncbi:MAG: dihydroneopterin aldolase [Bryobacterales bacterium]